MEWRSEYGVIIEFNPNLEARIDVPLFSFNKWGIYNHFFVEVEGDIVKIIPRYKSRIDVASFQNLHDIMLALLIDFCLEYHTQRLKACMELKQVKKQKL